MVQDTGLLNILNEIDPSHEFNKAQTIDAFRLLLTERLGLQRYSAKFPDDILEKKLHFKDFTSEFIVTLPSYCIGDR